MEYDISRPPYVKVSFGKLILFKDDVALQDYFAQEAMFMAQHGHRDEYSDQSMTIDGSYGPHL